MRYSFVLLLLITCLSSYAQIKDAYVRDSGLISRVRKEVIEFDKKNFREDALRLPFAGFIIKDVRFDTSSIGVKLVEYLLDSKGSFYKINLPDGATASIMKYLNRNANASFSASGCELLCFIKNLRITQVDSIDSETTDKKFNHLSFEIEAYLSRNDAYYPALRMDTTTIASAKNNSASQLLADVLNRLLEKSSITDTAKVFRRNSYTLAELNKRYQQRFEKPILRDSQLNAGVYKTFSEFINNNPSVKNFEFRKDKKATILYTKTNNGDWLPETDVYGFCNGKTIWINAGNQFYPLVRQRQTFEFLAFKDMSAKRRVSNIVVPYDKSLTGSLGTAVGASLISSGLNNLLINDGPGKVVYQVNMETGEYR